MADKYNARYKYYPDGTLAQIMVSSGCCFVEKTTADQDVRPRVPSLMRRLEEAEAASAASGDRWEHQREENERRGRSRARVRIFDLCQCNEFHYFVTLTLDPAKVDSYDYKAIIGHLNRWLDNRVRRKGLRYLVVPEYHKSGRIHFHGLFNDVLPRVDSGHKDKHGHPVYNLPDWTLGFTTAIELYGDKNAVSKYVTKYISKTDHIVGGRWYLHGGANLQEPYYSYGWLDYEGFSEASMFEYEPEAGYSFKICNFV